MNAVSVDRQRNWKAIGPERQTGLEIVLLKRTYVFPWSQFLYAEGGDDEIKMVLTWMDGWYKGDEDEAIIDTDVFIDNAKKFGTFCAANPTISIVNAAEKILGK